MGTLPFVLLFVYAIVGLAVAVGLIYFLVKRIDDKKKEDFEKRDN